MICISIVRENNRKFAPGDFGSSRYIYARLLDGVMRYLISQ